MALNADEGFHPTVDVALHRDHHLGGGERLARLHRHRLADVEALIHGRLRVDVVEDAVRVLDDQVLARLDGDDVRVILAAVLVDRDALRRGREPAIPQTVLHVHEDVAQLSVGRHHMVRRRRLGVRLRTGGLLAHVDWIFGGRRAREVHDAGTRRRAVRADGGRRLLHRHVSARIRLFTAATAGERGDQQTRGQRLDRTSHRHPPWLDSVPHHSTHRFARAAAPA